MEYTHNCINVECGAEYKDSDPDPYYCGPCTKKRKDIAAEVDRKIAARGPAKHVMSDLQRYDQAQKVRGFISAKDL